MWTTTSAITPARLPRVEPRKAAPRVENASTVLIALSRQKGRAPRLCPPFRGSSTGGLPERQLALRAGECILLPLLADRPTNAHLECSRSTPRQFRRPARPR